MHDLVFGPLAMDSSGYAGNRPIIKQRAAGYRELLDGYENATYTDMSIPYSAGALYSTVGDIFRWDQGLYSDTFLSAASREAMFTPHLEHYALGWRTDPLPVGSTSETVAAVHHGGNIPGFDTTVVRLRDKHDMIVILDNASHRHDIDELCRKILAVLLDKPYGSLKPPIGEVIRTDIVRSRAARAVEHYRQLKKDDPASFDFSESELNTLGYRLMEAGRVSDAVQIMQLNVEAFPSSANAYDSLGEAYLANHQNALAKDSYAKSLELNPQSDNARAVLAKLAH
jgi:CubicO group peptidase (beta-lactamase class C family)